MLINYHESQVLASTNHSASYTLLTSDTEKFHTNKGATGTITLSLPEDAVSGVYYTIFMVEKFLIKLLPLSKTIFDKNEGVTGKNYSSSEVDAYLQIGSDENGDWFIISRFGLWTREA